MRKSVRQRLQEILSDLCEKQRNNSRDTISSNTKTVASAAVAVAAVVAAAAAAAASDTINNNSATTTTTDSQSTQLEAVLFNSAHEHNRCKDNYKKAAKQLCSSLRCNSSLQAIVLTCCCHEDLAECPQFVSFWRGECARMDITW